MTFKEKAKYEGGDKRGGMYDSNESKQENVKDYV